MAGRGVRDPGRAAAAMITDMLVCPNPITRLPPRLRVAWLVVALSIVAAIGVISSVSPPVAIPVRQLTGTVVRVVEGDTIHVRIDDQVEKVRYIGVNTPEMRHPKRGEEFGAREATAVNRRLVEGRGVRLELDVQERDRYGRLLAYVWVGDVMVNVELVRLGYAQVMTVPPNIRHEMALLKLQREARVAARGLWGRR